MQVPALIQIHLQLPQIIILKLSVNLLSCSSAHFAVFPFLPQVLPLALATLLNIVLSSLHVCNGLLFPRNLDPSSLTSGNLDPLSLTPGGPIVPLICGFRRWAMVWCELFVNLYLGFDFKRITTTLSKFIGHIDLTDFCPILPKHSWNNGKQKCVGKFWYLKYLSSGIHLPNTPCIYLATPILDADI